MSNMECAEELAVLLRSLPRALSRFDRIEPLSPSKLFVLRYLACHSGDDIRASDIGPVISISPSGMTRIVEDLCAQRLLDKSPDRSDGRAVILLLTEEARELLRKHDDLVAKKISTLVDDLGAERATALADTLRRFLAMLE